MAGTDSPEKETYDYIGAYEKAIRDVVKASGSRDAANRMLDDLHDHYEKTGVELKRIKRIYGDRPETHETKKAALLTDARFEVNQIIERHVPRITDHVKELIIGTSLAATATMLPATYAISTLAVATGIITIGSSYYIGFNLIRKWKALAGKHKIASYAGVMSPRHVKAHEKVDGWLSANSFF